MRTAFALLGVVLCASALDAQTAHDPAAIVVAHGAEAEWNDRVREIAGLAETGSPVEVAFLMGPEAKARPFQDVVAGLVEGGASEIVVVPLLVSSHSGHYDQLRWLAGEIDSLSGYMAHHLEMAGITRPADSSRVRLAAALDDAPELAEVLVDRALALAESPSEQALFLIGHGPNSAEDYAVWMANLRPVAERVRSVAGFRDVKVGLVRDDAPAAVRAEAVRGIRETIALQRELTGRPVVVVPILVSEGKVSRETIPADLSGLDVVYTGEPILPHPALARWIARRVTDPGREVANALP
ncbi:MAG TPA: CbiX/SirB N-terminal domain-containing protein [Gemmatimonadota bacterium]|nr:CbiX/SirB N-terminal domain-containing protein [Gemmatimonadota bacterium]